MLLRTAQQCIQYYLTLKQFYSLVSQWYNNIILLITQSHLSVAQGSSSFQRLNMYRPMYATPTFKLKRSVCIAVLNDLNSRLTQCQFTIIRLVSMTHFNFKAMPTLRTSVVLVIPFIFNFNFSKDFDLILVLVT